MSRAVLELNDQALTLYVGKQRIGSSPGYVLALAGKPLFGQEAAEQSRVHPVSTNNEFWYRLSMEPLRRPLAHFRHYADIAHAHLMHLADISGYEGDIVISVPGSFSREQLGIMTGVIRQSPFNATAMLDTALLSAAGQVPEGGRLLFVDLQLHQFTLTLLRSEQQLKREMVGVVQGVGWNHLSNTLVQVINDAFIQQSRFNPQHSAVWEQHLYNELPDYLTRISQGESDLLVTINTDKASHQARVNATELISAMDPAFRKISQHAQQLLAHAGADGSVPVVLSERAGRIPGLAAWLGVSAPAVSGEQVAAACLRAADDLPSAGSSVPYVTAMRAREIPDVSAAASSAGSKGSATARAPTHVLLDHEAWSVERPCMLVRDGQRGVQLCHANDEADVLCSLTPSASMLTLSAVNGGVTVNGKPVSGPVQVLAGDSIALTATGTVLQLIRVRDE
jgi:hypothetical protein